MKTGRLQEATAALFLTTALINGANAYQHDEEASRAKGIAQGNQQQAAEWSAISDNEERGRNIYLGLAISDLGLTATFGALGASSIRRRREEEQEVAQPTQTTPEA
jgi:phospholipase/lecithinase/hemolysin